MPVLSDFLGLGAMPDQDPAPYGPDALTKAPGYDPLGPYLRQAATSAFTGAQAPQNAGVLQKLLADTVGAPARMGGGALSTLIGTPINLIEHGGTRQQLADAAIGAAGMMTVPTDAGAAEVAGIGGGKLGALERAEQPLGDLGSQMGALLQHGDLLDALQAKTADPSASFPAFQPPPVSYVDPAAQQWSLFHGSTPGPDFTANGGRFDPYFGNKPGGQEAGALFMSPSPEEASHYAGSLSDHGQEAGNRVFPLTVRAGRSALFDLPDMVRNDPTFRDEVVSNLTPEYGADAARQKADYALSDLDSQHQVNAQLAGMGLPTQPPTVHWMSGVTDAAVKRAQAQGMDTAVIRGLSESNGGDQIVALKPGTVFSRTIGEQLYNGGLALPTQPSASQGITLTPVSHNPFVTDDGRPAT